MQKRETAFRKSESGTTSVMLGPTELFMGCTDRGCYLLQCHLWALMAFALLQIVYLMIENCPTKDKYYIPLQRRIQILHMMDRAF